MFNATAPFKLEFKYSSIGPVILELRYPSDEEWVQRTLSKKLLVRGLGRGQSEFENKPNTAKDHDLYMKLALNGDPPPAILPNEASAVLDTMATCDVTEIEISGNEATVTMRVATGMIKHILKVPTVDQAIRWKAAYSRQIQLPHSQMESRTNIRISGDLWKELDGKTDGCIGPAPIIHRDQAVKGLIEHIDREMQPASDETNF